MRGVNFGWKADNPVMYGNKRAEIWGKMKDWLKTAHLPDDKELKQDLVAPRKEPDSSGVIFLESKKKMKARGQASPDAADALAVTFSYPIANKELSQSLRDKKNDVSSRHRQSGKHRSGAWMQ